MTTLHFAAYERASEIERALFKQGVRDATFVFAGPGSPTYALAQWAPLRFGEDLLSVLDNGGTLCISSAASLTLGGYTAPIYEVYKVGDLSPQWRVGLDVLGNFGLNCRFFLTSTMPGGATTTPGSATSANPDYSNLNVNCPWRRHTRR